MGEKKKILMIDDETDLCLMVKENLEETGEFEVTTTSKAEDAEALCIQQRPDLILLDNVMPGKKGSEIVKLIRNNPETKNMAVVMVSGKGEMVYSKKKDHFQWLPNNPMARARGSIADGKDATSLANAYGVDDYISKPFTTELLIEVIHDVLKRKTRQTESAEEGN